MASKRKGLKRTEWPDEIRIANNYARSFDASAKREGFEVPWVLVMLLIGLFQAAIQVGRELERRSLSSVVEDEKGRE